MVRNKKRPWAKDSTLKIKQLAELLNCGGDLSQRSANYGGTNVVSTVANNKSRPAAWSDSWIFSGGISMKKFLGTITLLLALALPGLAQAQTRLSAEDQKEFDKYYTKWVNDTRKNDRDDIAKDVHKMQQIMGRYNIQANVPFEQIASGGPAVRVYQGRLSADDQREFDKYYTKWVNDTRKNDRDDISKDVGRMQQIMGTNNIPASVPFDQIASTGYPGNGYPAAAYPTTNSQWQSRLSPDDQRDFDRYY